MNTKKLILILLSIIICLSLFSQESKLRVAVFDPTASGRGIDEGTGVAVRELISSALVNTGKYTIVERSMLLQVMKEQKFSNSDAVDENQATQIGKLAGANKIVLSAVSLVGGRNMLSIKMIDVKTATIDQQKTKVCQTNDLLDVVEPLTLELMGETSTVPEPVVRHLDTDLTISSYTNCNIEILQQDLYEEKVHWRECQCPKGWRLPTRYELECMCRAKERIGFFKTNSFSNYFTGETTDKGKIYIRSFDDCEESKENIEREKGWCRCVR